MRFCWLNTAPQLLMRGVQCAVSFVMVEREHKTRSIGVQGTASSKKKKQAKLKRVMHTVKRQARRERADGAEGFAAIQLLHDPQVLQPA